MKKYILLTSKPRKSEFTLGQVEISEKSIAIRESNGSSKTFQGEEVMAIVRSDVWKLWEEALAELESLKKNRNGDDREI